MKALFGPAGSSNSFYAQGNKSSVQMPAYLRKKGLDIFEYSGGHGLHIKEETALNIGQSAKEQNIGISIHAPYYINLSNPDSEKIHSSQRYVLETMQIAKWMGGKRVVMHPGSASGPRSRETITDYACRQIDSILNMAEENGLSEITLCPETMGKINQLGDLNEILKICSTDERLIPCIDFGHLNARTHGSILQQEDYKMIFDLIENVLGFSRLARLHIHFSHIEYSKMGERKHLTFEDKEYGPYHDGLIKEIVRRNIHPWVICESSGTQDIDALEMKKQYHAIKNSE